MDSNSDTPHQSEDTATLTSLVGWALGGRMIEVTDWNSEQIHSGGQAGSQTYHFSGNRRDQG